MNKPNDDVLQCEAMTRALRHWLRTRRESPPVIVSALTYEIAALVGRCATSLAEVDAAIDQVAATMKAQIRAFGVGKEHP